MPPKDADPTKVHRLFYPQVSIVVTVVDQGGHGGMPAIWCMPLSFSPSLIGVAIASEHKTYRLISEAEAFAVNWLDFSYARQVAGLGEITGKEHLNKLLAVGLSTMKWAKTYP